MTTGFRHEQIPLTNDWQTPRSYIQSLGPFDLDPCASERQHTVTAVTMWRQSIDGSGLMKSWVPYRDVWLNPPYDRRWIWRWMQKLADHGSGVALVYCRCDTNWFQEQVLDRATALYFIRQRVKFIRAATGEDSGKSSAPCVLVAYGPRMADRFEERIRLGELKIPGKYVRLRLL